MSLTGCWNQVSNKAKLLKSLNGGEHIGYPLNEFVLVID